LSALLNGTVAPWLLLGLGALILFALAKTFQFWRSSKKSPYFYMRRQAAQSLRVYLWISAMLIIAAGVVTVYARQAPTETPVTNALLTNAKPVAAEETQNPIEADQGITVIPYDAPPAYFEISALPTAERQPGELDVVSYETIDPSNPIASELLVAGPRLPDEFDQFDPAATLTPDTTFSPLIFSTDISENYEPVTPQQNFLEGFFTIYATFRYEAMTDGLEWAWVWRYNGEVVDGGNEIWQYGNEGPGWIYYQPPEGFSAGDYSLEVWVNGELFGQSSLIIESNVANQ
jgi:hypothetical protein